MPRMFFEETDKVRHIVVTQVKGYLAYLVGGCQQVSFGFKNNVFID